MRVLSKSPFDYITLCSWLSSGILMTPESLCFESSVQHVQLCSELLTACGRAGAEGSGGKPAGR